MGIVNELLIVIGACVSVPIIIYLISGIYTDKIQTKPFLSGTEGLKTFSKYCTTLIELAFVFLVLISLTLIFVFSKYSDPISMALFTALLLCAVVIMND